MFEKVISEFKNADTIGIFTHINPDGDAMGSSYGLKEALRIFGKKSEVFLLDDADSFSYSLIEQGDKTDICPENCDLLIALDCADVDRLFIYKDLFLNHQKTIAIDHHISHKDYAKICDITIDISSTCEVIALLIDEMGIEYSDILAKNIYIGLATDTGNFKYSSVSGDTMRLAGKLIDLGVDNAYLSKKLFDTKTKEYYSLFSVALQKIRFYCENKVAVLYLSDEDFNNSSIKESESGGIVNLPNSIDGVEVGVFIRQRSDDEYKVSLRSNNYVNVSDVAGIFGGGGHIRAAGYVQKKPVSQIVDELIKALIKVV